MTTSMTGFYPWLGYQVNDRVSVWGATGYGTGALLIAWVERPVRAVTYEPTGRWHRAFEVALHEADLPLVRVNPLQARRFAQAIGQRAKTDAVDARMLGADGCRAGPAANRGRIASAAHPRGTPGGA